MSLLPEEFKELEPYIDWSLATEGERIRKRENTSMKEIKEFYTHMFQNLERTITYLNQYPYDEMPEEAQNLCNMTFSLVEVCNLVEMYKSLEILKMVDSEKFVSVE